MSPVMTPGTGTRGLAARISFAIGLVSTCTMGVVAAQTPAEIRALLDKGQVEAAYGLARQAPERLGDPEFDLAFGIAAIHSGRAGEGVLALERFVLLFPRHESARLELARGYFLLGDDARAREEFELAAASKPSAAAARVIAEHLAAIKEREARYRKTFSGFVELGAGYDSNPRAGVDDPLVTLPVLGEVSVLDTGVRRSDRTAQAAAGFRATVPVTSRMAAFAAGQVELIRNADLTDFDQNVYAGSLGVMGHRGPHGWRLGASRGYQKLNRLPYRHTAGGFADWSLALDDRHAVSMGIQAGSFEYSGDNEVRNSDFQSVQVGLRRLLAGEWRPMVEASLNAGRERNDLAERQDLSRDLYGGRIGLAIAPFARWTFSGAATYQRSRYREPDAVLETTRSDRFAALELGLAFAVTPSLSVRAEISGARNDSNLALYEYRRTTAMIRGRYEIR